MDLNDKIQFWNNEIERAKEHGFYFDPDSVEEVVKEVEHLRDMLKRSRRHSRDRRKEVKLLQAANRKHKQKIKQLECLHPHFQRIYKGEELVCTECELVLMTLKRAIPI